MLGHRLQHWPSNNLTKGPIPVCAGPSAMYFVCDDHEFSCRINDEASICTAELLAIEAAIEYIWDSSDEEFMIITDSLSSLQALKSQKLNNPIVSNILHMCHYLSGHKDIIFCWVPSHIGIQGNERAINNVKYEVFIK